MFRPGDILTHLELCQAEMCALQKGMNFHLHGHSNVLLMSTRPNARYADRMENDDKTLIYECHDDPRSASVPYPKSVDQTLRKPNGRLNDNGKFFAAATKAKEGSEPELVRVYEKIKKGIWTFNGVFRLQDAWEE